MTLSCYDGHFDDSKAPGWTKLTLGTVVELRQPSTAVAALFLELAFWSENAHIVCPFV